MKRCSQCDFIYEDDQHVCDMDGNELVYEPTLHGFPVNAATKPPTPTKSAVRRQAIAAVLAVVIATLLSVGYAGFTRENLPQSTKAPSTNVIPAPQPEPEQTPPTTDVSPTPSESDLEKTKVSPAGASPIALSTPRSTDPPRQTIRSQPTKANHKKESRIGGFLKKTGNLLKKPFKKL